MIHDIVLGGIARSRNTAYKTCWKISWLGCDNFAAMDEWLKDLETLHTKLLHCL